LLNSEVIPDEYCCGWVICPLSTRFTWRACPSAISCAAETPVLPMLVKSRFEEFLPFIEAIISLLEAEFAPTSLVYA
jgi:hypothetical protein